MTVETFFANFGYLADAPNGVQKLRELVLQLAVQGKLVSQDANDKPATALLEKIETERKILLKEGRVRKPKKYDSIKVDEQFCPLPNKWCWARMGELILDITGGGTPSKNNPSYWGGDIPWASVKDVGKTKYLDSTIDSITPKGLQESSSNLIPKGRVIICTRMGLGKISINRVDVAINQDLKALWLPENLEIDYFFNFFLTQEVKGTGMTVAGIRQDALLNMPIPLPPLEEQKRIVAKVDQLMALCDELEARQQKQQQGRVRLNNAALDALLTAREPDEFADHWQRISTNFDLLYDHPETIAKLRAAILQLAVQGKLVPQDPNDEPASVLLERIKAEKERLVKEKKVKKGKALAPIVPNLLPWELPEFWQWVRFGEIAADLRYGTSKRCDYKIAGDPVLRIPNLKNGVVDVEDLKFTNLTDKERQDLSLKEGDLLLIRSNGSVNLVGRSAVIGDSLDGYSYAGYLVRVRSFPQLISTRYIHLMLESSYVRGQIEGPIRTTSGVKNINSTEISNLLISVPPLEEQKRIVTKVDQLMSLCDELEAKLNQVQQHSEKLMEATVRNFLVA